MGIGEASLPRAWPRHPAHALHRDRRRRHVGRRVRQRHAALQGDQAARRVRPPAHLHRSRARSGARLGRAQAPVRPAALVVDGLRQEAAVGRRRHLRPRRQVDHALGRGARGAGRRETGHDADRPDARHPEGAGRPALFRRHRHLREGLEREQRRCRRPRQRRAAHRRLGCARQGHRRGRQSRLHPARPHRGGAGRPQDQHRRARQFGRRRYLRPRGQYQDRDRRGDRPRRAGGSRPRCPAVQHDRRGGGAGAAPQLPAEPGDQRGRSAGRRGARSAGALHARCSNGRAGSTAPSSSCPTRQPCARAPRRDST